MTRRPDILALTLVFMLCSFIATSAHAQGFRDVHTQDGIDVWAVGEAGAIFRSQDGGATWNSYPLGEATHRGVAARASRVWIVDDLGRLWTSIDGGQSFAPTTPGGGVPLHAITFADDQTGWIVGAYGRILKTTDGGDTWSFQSSGTASALFAVQFTSLLDGWACGALGLLLHTTDGGASWSITNPLGFGGDLYDLIIDGLDLYIAGAEAFVAHSSDGGGSWSTFDLEIASQSDVNGLALTAGGRLWLCGGGGFLRSTADGGDTWNFAEHPIATGLSDVHFQDANNGWACAERSKNVARTSDGGLTWSVPGGAPLSFAWSQRVSNLGQIIRGNTLRIDPFNRHALYAVQGLRVYKSWDVGETWTWVATISGGGFRTNAFVVSPTDSLTWLALVQEFDRITRTTDGGATWTATISVPFTEYGLPMEQDEQHPNTVYFGPEDGKIWKSTDFGTTWTAVCDSIFRSPDDISVVSDTTGVLYVADGVTGVGSAILWKSSDGGATWSAQQYLAGSESPMLAVTPHDRNLGYATTWPFGGVWRTTDMGETWEVARTTPSEWGADIAKDDPAAAITAVYSGSKAHVTLDGGDTWVQTGVSGSNYGALAYDRGTYFLHQSDGIWKGTVIQPDMPAGNAESLVLDYPAGDEILQYGDLEPIQWTSQNIAELHLEFQQDPFEPWSTLAAAAPAAAGSWDWTVPNAPSTYARIRISDAYDAVPVDGTVVPFTIVVPDVVASQSSLDFGLVVTGNSAADTLRIDNDGTATLVVSSVTAAQGGPFTPDLTSFSVPPGESATLAVVFEPQSIETFEDTLVIACNAPQHPVRIPLVGVGSGGIAVAIQPAPARFDLLPSRPNPFGASGTIISYALPRAARVELGVYNVLGQKVAELVNRRQEAGRYAVRFPDASLRSSGLASALPSGVYFCRLRAGAYSASRRMVLVR